MTGLPGSCIGVEQPARSAITVAIDRKAVVRMQEGMLAKEGNACFFSFMPVLLALFSVSSRSRTSWKVHCCARHLKYGPSAAPVCLAEAPRDSAAEALPIAQRGASERGSSIHICRFAICSCKRTCFLAMRVHESWRSRLSSSAGLLRLLD
uniref:Uncharacterized protein n=1 Tax=Ralstonia solanacearum TaxID=305 RepID=A0A0S4VA41_RALSL|nr:protein of unknown function [Ralstonia solanacearum]